MTSNGKFCRRLQHNLRSLITAVAFCAFLACGSQAQESKLSPEKRTQIEAAVSSFMASTHVPGVSIAIVENGEYEWGSGFGFADLENNVPASEHTLFRLGSISKSLTATGAMQLWERGQTRSRRARPEILPGVSAEAMADHHAPGDGTFRWYSPLQGQYAGRS